MTLTRNSFTSQKEFFNALIANPTELEEYLQQNTDALLQQDEEGMTLLHLAVHSRDAAMTTADYITKEALSVRDHQGRTPVRYVATRADSLDVFRQIFPLYMTKASQLGYDFSITDNDGSSPFFAMLANYDGNASKVLFPGMLANYDGNASQIVLGHKICAVAILNLYVDMRLYVNDLSGGLSLLGMSIALNDLDSARLLLSLGADPTMFEEPASPNENSEFTHDPIKIAEYKLKLELEKIAKLRVSSYTEQNKTKPLWAFHAGEEVYIDRLQNNYIKPLEALISQMKQLTLSARSSQRA